MVSFVFQYNQVTDHRLKMNFELTSFLDGDIEIAMQSCVTVEQKELLEELAESVGATTTVEAYEKKILLRRRYC
ncbi:hypothetical protein Dimus_018004 [Dionaea muscipula]